MAYRIATTFGSRRVSEVQDYLPANYAARPGKDGRVLIIGEDDHGWTLDGYVIPRLGSALIGAVEMAITLQGQPVLIIGRADVYTYGEVGEGLRLQVELICTDGSRVRGEADVDPHADEYGVRQPLGFAVQDWISPALLKAAEDCGVLPQLIAELTSNEGVPRIATLGAA